jgi:hypothetical protein
MNNIIEEITNEIYDGIMESMKDYPERDIHVGSHKINKSYNIFAWFEPTIASDEQDEFEDGYFEIHLEEYDINEDCINPEVDIQDTGDNSKEDFREAIAQLLSRNKEILESA